MESPLSSLRKLLENDFKVKIAGVDVDGVLRGKTLSKSKFLSVIGNGMGICSCIFRWDMHDEFYDIQSSLWNSDNGNRDIWAVVDLRSLRRIPWENNIPFFFASFVIPSADGLQHITACPRTMVHEVATSMGSRGWQGRAGVEYEFKSFHEASKPQQQPSEGLSLKPLTDGHYNYSMLKTLPHKDYYDGIFDACREMGCHIDSMHTNSGYGCYEVALACDDIEKVSEKAILFKWAVKAMGVKFGITPTFMARPQKGLPGNGGHMHISLHDIASGTNLFTANGHEPDPKWLPLKYLSVTGRQFLAGVLDGLGDVLPLLLPNINSYKRTAKSKWCPLKACWGWDNRRGAIRLITPPMVKPQSTRLEIRTPGADANPSYVLAAIFALGVRGIEKRLEIKVPPLGMGKDDAALGGENLPWTLERATERFMHKDSIAREILGDEFVDHFGISRQHEVDLWHEQVTDWEIRRYLEQV